MYIKASPLSPAPWLRKTARIQDNKLQAAGLVAQGFHLLLDHYKIGKLQECKATIVAADWWLLAGGSVLKAVGLHLGALWRSLGGSWEPLCSHWVPLGAIGCH